MEEESAGGECGEDKDITTPPSNGSFVAQPPPPPRPASLPSLCTWDRGRGGMGSQEEPPPLSHATFRVVYYVIEPPFPLAPPKVSKSLTQKSHFSSYIIIGKMADSTFSTFSKRLWNVLSCLLVSSKTIYGSVSIGIHATAIPCRYVRNLELRPMESHRLSSAVCVLLITKPIVYGRNISRHG